MSQLPNTDQRLEVSDIVGADAARRGELAVRTIYVLVVIVMASFATAVIAVVTREVPWMIAFAVLMVASLFVSGRGVRLAREGGAAASAFLSQRLGYPVTVQLPRRQSASNWHRQINAAIRAHEATHAPADSASENPADRRRRRLGEVDGRLAELQAEHSDKVLGTTKWVYPSLLGVAPIVAAGLLIRHLPLWLLFLAVAGLLELAFCEVQIYKRLLAMRQSTSDLRHLREERRTLLPPGEGE
ncbi:MAG: hypothetical protein WBA31_05905 [Candidatus Dormiibacterota bacterium]